MSQLKLNTAIDQLKSTLDTSGFIEKIISGTINKKEQIPANMYNCVKSLYVIVSKNHDIDDLEPDANECIVHTQSLLLSINGAFAKALDKELLEPIKQDAQIRYYNILQNRTQKEPDIHNMWAKTIRLLFDEIFDKIVNVITKQKLVAYLSINETKEKNDLQNMNKIKQDIADKITDIPPNKIITQLATKDMLNFIRKSLSFLMTQDREKSAFDISFETSAFYAFVLQQLIQKAVNLFNLYPDPELNKECQMYLFELQPEIINMGQIINNTHFLKQTLKKMYETFIDEIAKQLQERKTT